MLSKYSILALIGATNAAPGTLPHTTTTTPWPAFAAVVAPSSGASTLDGTTSEVLAAFVGSNPGGEIRGYRNQLMVFPQQKITKATAAGTFAAVVAATTGYRTYYTIDKTKLAAFPTKGVVATDSTWVDSDSWTLCLTYADGITCNGGVSIYTGPVYKAIVNRIGYKQGQTGFISVGGANALIAYNQNEDIIMGTMYQSSAATPTTTGDIWCSAWSNKLVQAGTEAEFSATMGLTMMSKCTWQLIADNQGFAPGFTLKSLSFSDWEMQVIEWINPTALGTNAVMGATADTTYHTGAYAEGTDKNVFLNPTIAPTASTVTGIGTTGNGYKQATFTTTKYADPIEYIPGSVGPAIYYPGKDGPWKETQLISHDQSVLMDRFSFVSTTYNSYSTALTEYNSLKTTYNDAATKESERLKDFFKATFDPPVIVPKRPCQPTQPAEYSGTYFDIQASVTNGWKTTFALQGNLAALKTDTGSGAHVDKFHSRIKYLYNSQDAASITTTSNIGHVWGRFGQGLNNVPLNTMPFYFGVDASTNLAGMNVSAFPSTDTTTGLAAAANKIEFTCKAQAFVSYDSFKVATRPGASEAPTDILMGAKALIATGLAAATVISTIA